VSGDVLFREARASDSDAIAEIFRNAGLAFRPEGLNATNGDFTHVCELQGAVVAALQSRLLDVEAELFDIAVDRSRLRQGIGGRLLSSWLEFLRERRVREVFLEVRESNAAAFAFYRKFGFAQIGRRPGYYSGPSEAALILRLKLPNV